MKTASAALFLFLAATSTNVVAFQQHTAFRSKSMDISLKASSNDGSNMSSEQISRRGAFAKAVSGAVTAASVAGVLNSGMRPEPANAIGPVKINLLNPTYTAIPCPKDRPIPGEKAMKGMRGLCVTVDVDLEDFPDRALDKVGVYGYITDKGTGESVLANNPDLSTDAGQFAIIPKIETTEKKTQFEFIAAVPSEMDMSPYENGIAPLTFKSLRVVSFPGGQQYGSINPCEMNEFSDECDVWEEENGPYTKGNFMIKSNERTKGR
mmetsp:Transcript_6585/g.14002  ORF Transcript_6585/g.14002 Transcript_6585/m.14002 type:complete len:265 (-) Transcript_6585:185-979(-)|eukprot:CAMPEP_0168179762 /NCGR_PEP_ID=MMETSP0139_2-20121125/10051_1 /TAXON_ID=44445 /ORGANISM="Pseudo-nitzschia australis, Strain 10249 10 AB" /LENGTH=264 /DNA_ID=CAMNT_0008099683 /DNA_START=162 /DNA_END=956 /DNA_ORIENTATION=-